MDIDLDLDSDDDEEIDFSKRKGPLREWLVLDRIRKQIGRQFKTFLTTFENEKGGKVYFSRIEVSTSKLINFKHKFIHFPKEACLNNKQSLVIDFDHLKTAFPYLAMCLADAPTEMLQVSLM